MNIRKRKNLLGVFSQQVFSFSDVQEKGYLRVAVYKNYAPFSFRENGQLKGIEVDGIKNREKQKEDRKDERTKIQASQQSELINQRQNDAPPKKFESSGNDNMSGFDLGSFGPM